MPPASSSFFWAGGLSSSCSQLSPTCSDENMAEPIIEVRNLSKAYRIWQTPSARLKSPFLEGAARFFGQSTAPHRALAARAAKGYRDFYALRDLSFTVRRGEGSGIIGRR